MLMLLLADTATAIIMRHDTGYGRYFATETEYPAVFHLERRGDRRVCVATLIDTDWAITAAHCLDDTPLGAHLARGSHYPVEIAGQQVAIVDARVHPHYPEPPRRTLPDVDVALLKLERALDFPRPVPIYRHTDENGLDMTFLGWGFHGVGSGGQYIDDGRFRRARNVVSKAHYRLHFVFDDPREPGSAALALEGLPGLGDSGGPALVKVEDRWHIAGVAVGELSRGGIDEPRQGLYGAEVLYERLSRHQRWIDAVLAGAFPRS